MSVIDLSHRAFDCARKIYGSTLPNEVVNRLNEELFAICEVLGNDGIGRLLMVSECANAARNELGLLTSPGRGLAVSSLVNYCLGITLIDPIKFNIPFNQNYFAKVLSESLPCIEMEEAGKEQLNRWISDSMYYGASDVKDSIERPQIITFYVLDKMKVVCRMVKERHGMDIDLYNIPVDDEKTLQLFQNYEMDGVWHFQEERMQDIYQRHGKPFNFGELVDFYANSIIGEVSRAHAISYTYLCFQMAYLKAHFPEEYRRA